MVDVAGARVVALLTRAPSSGGKSRLFASLGRPPDPALLEALLLDTLDGLGASGVRHVVAVDPPSACEEVRAIVPAAVAVVAQPPGSLGDRMRGTLTRLLDTGARAVVLVGSDLPEIESATVAEAFALLDENPDVLVLGPAADGGYYLIGACRVPDVFGGIPWGAASVFAETVAAAGRAGVPVSLVSPLADVDAPADLERVAARRDQRAYRTRAWIRRHGYC